MVAFSLFFVRSLVYVFYITGGPRDLMPYIPTLTNRVLRYIYLILVRVCFIPSLGLF
jgi:hypothetical protein